MRNESVFETRERRFNEMRRGLLGEGMHLHNGHGSSSPAVMTADLPGFDKKDVSVEGDEEGIHVAATRTSGRDVRNRRSVRHERHGGSFERSVGFRA